jgi:hypothetical protein
MQDRKLGATVLRENQPLPPRLPSWLAQGLIAAASTAAVIAWGYLDEMSRQLDRIEANVQDLVDRGHYIDSRRRFERQDTP